MLRETLRRDGQLGATGNEVYALADVPSSLREALARFGAAPDGLNTTLERQLENVDQPYSSDVAESRAAWPGFLFPLADPGLPEDGPLPPAVTFAALNTEEQSELTLDKNPPPTIRSSASTR